MSSICNFFISIPVYSQLCFEVDWGKLPSQQTLFLDWIPHGGKYQPYERYTGNLCSNTVQVNYIVIYTWGEMMFRPLSI